MVSWNDFQRELQNRVSDSGTRYMLALMYERILELSKSQDAAGNCMVAMAETMGNIVKLNDVQESRLQDLRKQMLGEHDGVQLDSVPLLNEDD